MSWAPLLLWASLGATPRTPHDAASTPASSIQRVVDEFRARLLITADVTATVVPANALLVSVEAATNQGNSYVLSFEARFLEGLNDEEVRAVVAHELGHVWIFTHHPYLQTERLANEVAMRVVTRESLKQVYMKVWERGGAKGDLIRFLGE